MRLKKSLFWAVSVCAIFGIVVLLLVLRTSEEDEGKDTASSVHSELPESDINRNRDKASSDPGTKERKRRKPRLPTNAIDPKKRAEILALILSALQEKESKKEKTPPKESLRPGGLSKEYIRQAVQEITPLLKECYEMELEEREFVKGKVVLGFDLIADDEHGGLVEEVSLLESELTEEISDSFSECLRETIYALRLEAPKWGGRYTVRYPLYFNSIGYGDGK